MVGPLHWFGCVLDVAQAGQFGVDLGGVVVPAVLAIAVPLAQ
jgi:hypothetical protein